jgi:F0F1-type ATP synthase membrane subunit c/vacuolar-type H+-ATPase subunit K
MRTKVTAAVVSTAAVGLAGVGVAWAAGAATGHVVAADADD